MASSGKRPRVEESDSDDSDSSFEIMEETTGGMDSGEESELDRLLIDESVISSDEEREFSLQSNTSDTEWEEDEGETGAPGSSAPAVDCGGDGGRQQARGGGHGPGRARGQGHGDGLGAAARVILHDNFDDPDLGNPPLPFTPRRPAGIDFGQPLLRNTMTRAVDFLNLFFTVEIINSIVEHTNSYAYTRIMEGSHRSYAQRDGSWKEVTADEIKRMIAILIYFGLVRVGHSIQWYWSTATLFHGLWARACMDRTRLKALMAMLCVVDPGNEVEGDKLRKVKPLLDIFKQKFQELYQPRQNVAIDERIVKSKHRSGIKQFNKDKPTRWGIKLWVLADSSNGYTIDFNVYVGKAEGRNVSAKGLGYDVVMKLMDPYFNQGYHLYVDNFYTSVTLFKDLFAHGVRATGTIREIKRDFPENLKNSKQWAKGKDRGSVRWGRDGPCLAVQWLDNKVVSVLTTIDNANVETQATRKCRNAQGKWTTKDIPQPGVISNYNKYMNAVDRSDQILATHNVLRKCVRWWKTLFFHLIDMAIVNGFILFQEHRRNFPDDPALKRTHDYSLYHFRAEIVRQLCGLPEYDHPPVSSASRPAPPPPDHGPFVTEHIPVLGEERKNCVVCWKREKKQLRVQTYCKAPQCNRYMHVANDKKCFELFHSPDYPYKR
ncbi:PREDICTED: piggyBac transposable element-derived protein 4-like [Acropora digitifera]|uniref:piggyBac transposable element-derived protein 4-like n=1 Tax=Acropora digitifera TaxID=70779 RepID=UPI00077AF77D|nr:PREDICTED: piggyBac transposable element-derived protein 4-like [Acropora digitifera]